MHSTLRKTVIILASIALAVALVPVATIAATQKAAGASSAPCVTVKRAANGVLALEKGTTYKLRAKTTAGKLTYKSSKKAVVTVTKKGKLVAKKPGKAIITVKAKSNGQTAVKKVKVTVVGKGDYVHVRNMHTECNSTLLERGETSQIKTIIKPGNASNVNVVYKSSKPKVLSVDAYGKVTAKKPGKAIVTITSCASKELDGHIHFEVTGDH